MASRWAPGDYDQLHHFISSGVWNEAPLEEELAIQADKLIGGASAVLVIDDGAAEEGVAFGRGRAAIRIGARQDRQLPDAGVADAGAGRGSGDDRQFTRRSTIISTRNVISSPAKSTNRDARLRWPNGAQSWPDPHWEFLRAKRIPECIGPDFV